MQTSIHTTVYAITLALLLPGTLMAGETSDKTRTRKEAIQLTQSVEGAARKIQMESEHLSVMQKTTNVSNRTHQYKLHLIATQINEQLQPALKRLAEMQPELPQWHQNAIEQMRTSAATLAANANAAVLNRGFAGVHQPAPLDPDYGQLLKNISSQAQTLVQMADATADYGGAQLKGHRAGLAIASHD
jgi:exonuclease VII large subunit